MPEVTADRRNAPRYAMALAAEVVELPRGARLIARTSDISRTGCYLDTLNPIAGDSQVQLRIRHHEEVFEALGRVVYLSPGLGMGIVFETVAPEQQAMLQRWLESLGPEE
jgi:hypothetical protein